MHRLADTNTRSKRDTRLGNDRQACRKPHRTLTSAQLCFHSCAPEFMHIYRITGCIACKLLRDESPWLVTPVGARAHTHAQYPPLSAHIATDIQVDGIARHSSPPWLPLERFFHPFNRSHRFYPRKGDKARCHLRISMRFSASAKVGVSRDDGRHRDDSKWLLCWDFILYSTTCYCCAFRCFFLFLSSVDIFREGTNLRSERILKRVL